MPRTNPTIARRLTSGPITCVYRFVGTVPPPGYPLLVDDDEPGPGEPRARIMGERIRKRVSHLQENTLKSDLIGTQLTTKLDEGHTLKELGLWAESLNDAGADKEKLLKTIGVAFRLNDKSLLRSVLLPCKRALFLGFITSSQPPPATSAAYGLNHARVIVSGSMTSVCRFFTKGDTEEAAGGQATNDDDTAAGDRLKEYRESDRLNGKVRVCGEDVGIIVNGQHILIDSGVSVRIQGR